MNLTVPVTTSSGRSRLVAVFLVCFVLGLVTAALGAAMPGLRREFGLAGEEGGWLVSAYNLGALAAILICGFGGRRFRQRVALGILLALFACGALAMGFAGSWSLFCGATVVAGAGYGGLVVYLNSIIARQFSEHGFLMLSLINAMFGVGAVLGPLTVSVTGDQVRIVFLVAGLLAPLGAGIGGLPAAPRSPVKAAAPDLKIILAFLGMGFLYAGLETGIGAWEATHLARIGHDPAGAARLASLFWVGLCVGRFVIPALARHQAPHRIVRVFLILAAGSLIVAANPVAAPFAYAACGFFLAPVLPAVLNWVAQSIEDNQSANALVFTASMAGSVVLPMLVGLTSQPAAIPLAIGMFAVLASGIAHRLAVRQWKSAAALELRDGCGHL